MQTAAAAKVTLLSSDDQICKNGPDQGITAAALGGCALKSGIAGRLLAVLLLGALNNGLNVVGVNTFWQNVAQGALLVLAVVIQQRRSGERAVGLPT